jgi:hypothetical protein
MKLSEEHGIQACISKTLETPPSTKIESMAEYLHDVSIAILEVRKLAHVKAVQHPLQD